MDSYFVKDLYQSYKAGTRCAIQWLVDSVGQVSDSSSGSARQHSTTTLTTRDLERLGRHIFDASDPSKRAPEGIDGVIVIFESTIAKRREYSRWISNKPRSLLELGADLQAELDAHEHFIDTLESMLNNIKLARDNSKAAAARTRKPQLKRTTPVKSFFDHTNPQLRGLLDETITASNEAGGHNRDTTHHISKSNSVKPRRVPSHKAVVQNDIMQDDQRIATVWTFLNSAYNIRKFLKATWSDYRLGKLGLETAAVVTNRAFYLIRENAATLVEDHPDLSTFDGVASLLDISASLTGSKANEIKFIGPRGDQRRGGLNNGFESLCAPAYSLLLLILEFLSKQLTDVDRAFEAWHQIEAAHYSGSVILEIRHHLSALAGHQSWFDPFGEDLFTSDLISFITGHRLELHFVPCFQIYMDILDAVDEVVGRQSMLLIQLKSLVEHSTNAFERRAPELHDFDLFRADHDKRPVRQIYMDSLSTLLDLKSAKEEGWLARQDALEDPDNASSIFVWLPVLTGKYLNCVTEHAYGDGVLACNRSRMLIAMAHLYRAALRSGLLKTEWRDMEFVIAHHGEKAFRLRGASASSPVLLSAARQYGLALGVALKSYSKSRTSLPVDKQRADLPTYNSIIDKKCSEIEPTLPYWRVLDQCLETAESLHFAETDCTRTSLYRLAEEVLTRPSGIVDVNVRNAWNISKCLTDTQLLQVLQASMVSEELNFHFDYHTFCVMCANLLDVAKAKRGAKMFEPRSFNGVKDGYFLYEMVDEILWEAAELEQESAEKVENESTLAKVAEFLEDWLKDGRAVLLDAAKLATGVNLARNESSKGDPTKAKKSMASAGEPTMKLCGGKMELVAAPLPEEFEILKAEIKAERRKKAEKRRQRKFRVALKWQPFDVEGEVEEEVYYSATEDLEDDV